MRKKQLFGIEVWLKENKKLEVKDIIKIHHRLMHKFPMPSINIEDYEKCNPGSRITIHMKGVPAPGLDVFKGKFTKSDRNDLGLPVYASFRTTTGTTLKPLKQIKKGQYSTILPKKVTNGLVGIVFPIQESFGPKELLDEFPMEIQDWIKRSKHISRSNLTKEDCPTPPTPSLNYRYIATIAPQPLRFNFSPTCTVCPFGAIKIAPTYCYVDPYICRGQKYSRLNGNQRGEEEICWSCFNPSDGAVSTKCDYVTLRKVLHLNPDAPRKEVPCCGGCDLALYCSRGAVYKPTGYYYYAADKKKCNGCMECYQLQYCPWNCGTMCASDCEQYDDCSSIRLPDGTGGTYTKDIHNNYTIRMVAQIDEKLKLVLGQIVWRVKDTLPMQRQDSWYFDPDDFDYREADFSRFDLMVWGDKQENIPIKLDKTGVHKFNLKEIPFTKSVHLGLFEKEGKPLGFYHCGSNFPIKSLGAKRYSDPTKFVDGGTFDFYSPMGRIQIEYMIK